MIHEIDGNVLDHPTGVIVHGCNSHGVMNSGIAKEVKARYPEAFQVYRKAYEAAIDAGLPGLPLGSLTIAAVGPGKIIVNAVTQEFYGREPGVTYVSYEALKTAFEAINDPATGLRYEAEEYGVHFPLIGCGLAQGKWEIVGPIIDEALDDDILKMLWIFNP